MKRFLISLVLFIPFVSFSQLDIVITSNRLPLYPIDGDTLSICRDSLIIFEASVTDAGVPVTNAEYYWDFDDGNKIIGTDTNLVSHIYPTNTNDTKFKGGGGYRVKLKVIDQIGQTGYTILPVRVAVPPKFTDTKVNIPDGQLGVCKGSTTELIGKAWPDKWEDEPTYEFEELAPDYFDDLEPYTSSIPVDEFPLYQSYSAGAIDSIAITLIHSDMGNLKISLFCETGGDTMVLKDYSAINHAVLGDTVNNIAYTFLWSESFSETMNESTVFNINTGYLPDESFDNLIGCSMNGDWTIKIEDNMEADSGFMYRWNIKFNEDIIPPIWTFSDSLKIYKIINDIPYGTYWTGTGINIVGETNPSFSGDTILKSILATSNIYGSNGSTFHIITNWGCPQDTSISLVVEEPVIDANPSSGEAKLEVTFTDKTSWAVFREWNFGDKETFQHILDTITHKYLEKGTYEVIMISKDNKDCTDSDTVTIEVSVELSNLDNIPNMFSPNEDLINDLYKFKEDDLKGMKEFRMVIYNRYGQKVFESIDYEQMINVGWDGRTQPLGLLASPGIYFYVIRATGKDGKEYKEKGSIQIFR